MSYTKMGYTKSIYGIIADAIKEELKIYFLKSDYFYNKDRTNWKQELLLNLSAGRDVQSRCMVFTS